MKKINILLGALVCMFAFTACTDEVGYTPTGAAEGVSGAYFPADQSTSIILTEDVDSFDISICRTDTAGDLVLNLDVQKDSLAAVRLSIPDTVKFESGKDMANITIKYNPASLVRGESYDVVISIAQNDAMNYQNTAFAFTAKFPQLEKWKSLGMATYTDDFITTFFNVQNVTYEVEVEQDSINPGRYRLKNPYGAAYPYNKPGDFDETEDHYMYINADDPDGVYMPIFFSGMDWGYGEFVMWSMAGNYVDGGLTLEEVKAAGVCGKLKDGVITFPSGQLLVAMMEYNNAGLYYANNKGKFQIALPGAVLGDFSVGINCLGTFYDASNQIYADFSVTMGKDVKSVRVAMAITDDVEELVKGVKEGTVKYVEINESGNVHFPMTEPGTYTAVAVSYAKGEAKESAYAEIKNTEGEVWNSLGMAKYTDDFMASLFEGVEPVTYDVEIQEKEGEPGLYRLVNPYGAIYPYNEPGDWDAENNYYLEINAVDPQGVYIATQQLGFDWGYGMMIASSLAGYYMENGAASFEEVKAAGYCGALVDGVITFPTKTLLVDAPALNGPYYANSNSAFRVELPSASKSSKSVKSVVNKANVNKSKVNGESIGRILCKSSKRFK